MMLKGTGKIQLIYFQYLYPWLRQFKVEDDSDRLANRLHLLLKFMNKYIASPGAEDRLRQINVLEICDFYLLW